MTSLGLGSSFPLHSLSAQRDWLQVEAAAGATPREPGLLSPAPGGFGQPWSLAFVLRVTGGSGLLYRYYRNANVV